LSDIFTVKVTQIPALEGRSHAVCTPQEKWSKFEASMRNDERLKNVLQSHHKERLAAQRAKIGL
jgi:Leucine-rich repeat (LRR) protein